MKTLKTATTLTETKLTSSTESNWLFGGKPFTSEQVGKYEGFIYQITNRHTGKKYIGRKYFFSIRKVKGKRNRQRTESDWQSYYGSSKELQKQVKELGSECFLREILSLHKTRGDTNYSEVRTQFLLNVLEDADYINDAIGKYRQRPPDHIKNARHYANTDVRDSFA
jgi:hypothetical protein